jgi:hypothetical protein
MENAIFGDPATLLAHLSDLKSKIQTLQFITKQLDGSEVEIRAKFKEGDSYLIDQSLIPFNLSQELRVIIGDSIDEYQRQIVNLSSTL